MRGRRLGRDVADAPAAFGLDVMADGHENERRSLHDQREASANLYALPQRDRLRYQRTLVGAIL